MRFREAVLASCCALLLTPAVQGADNQQQLRDRLKAASEFTSLDGAGSRQWYWKMEVTLYGPDGRNPKPGTLEMWSRNGEMRTTATLGSDQVTVLRKGDVLYVSGDPKPMLSLAFIQMQVLHPISDEAYEQALALSLNREDKGNLHLDCIAPTLVKPTKGVLSINPPFSFCLGRNTPNLVVTIGSGGERLVRMQTGVFQSHQVPMELNIFSGQIKRSEARTTTLTTQPDDPSLFAVTPQMKPFTGPLDAAGEGSIQLSANPPVYPELAKANHLSGTVVFDAVIGKDGRVSSLQPTGDFPALLRNAARDAVSTWRYRPFQISGVAFELKTQIKVNFAMN